MKTADTRILIVGPNWIGDMVMAQSLFISLKQRLPASRIEVLAPAWSRPLLARMPEVDAAIDMPLGHGELGLKKRRDLGRSLRARAYGQAIILPRSFKAALIPFHAGAPVRTGYRGEMRYGLINDMRALDKRVLTQVVQRFVALGLPAGASLAPEDIPAPSLTVDEDNRSDVLQALHLNTKKPIIALMPGAEYGPAKRWPQSYYGELARALTAAGKQVWIFGSAGERALGAAICAMGGDGCMNLCGRTRLHDAIDLLSLAERAVTNDSGLMHIAAALGIRLIALYGSSSPAYTPPLTPQAKVIYLGLGCSPCFERECPLDHRNCLKHIQVHDVQRHCLSS